MLAKPGPVLPPFGIECLAVEDGYRGFRFEKAADGAAAAAE